MQELEKYVKKLNKHYNIYSVSYYTSEMLEIKILDKRDYSEPITLYRRKEGV